jgi:hypothetical protein
LHGGILIPSPGTHDQGRFRPRIACADILLDGRGLVSRDFAHPSGRT